MISLKSNWKRNIKAKINRVLVIFGLIFLSSLYAIYSGYQNINYISKYRSIENYISKYKNIDNSITIPNIETIENYQSLPEVEDKNYFVKTSGCQIAKMEIMTDKIKPFISMDKPDDIHCGSPPITASDEKFLWINLTEIELMEFYNVSLSQLSCKYVSFRRVSDDKIEEDEDYFSLLNNRRVEIDEEYIRVFCYNQTDKIYEDFYNFFPSTLNDSEDDEKVENKFNVMVFGIDSMSKMNFHRMLKKTVKTLKDFNAIEFHGYNKIDDNTYSNLIPFLLGLTVDELNLSCLPKSSPQYFDNCDFIWKIFKENGFQTLFSEDSANFALFHYLKTGFDKQPTDHYYRTMLHPMENKIGRNRVANFELCLGHRTTFDVFMNGHVKKLIKSNLNEISFSFLWTCTFTHDYINDPLRIDDDLSEFLKFMKDEKHLENTILFLVSDHGLRYGEFRSKTVQGMLEERLPSLFALIPESFEAKYPFAVKNLKKNSKRLTTHFDMHETLKDLAIIDEGSISNENIRIRQKKLAKKIEMPRGISLFLEAPEYRTCDHAGIESHWCTCHKMFELSSSDDRAQKAANFVVETINNLLKPHPVCPAIHLNSTVTVFMKDYNDGFSKNETSKTYDIMLKITTDPGSAEFEATVRFNDENNEIKLGGVISRLNSYKTGCVNDAFIEKYCYCPEE